MVKGNSISINKDWNDFKDVVVNAIKKVAGKKFHGKKPWFTDEINELMNEKQKVKLNSTMYQKLNH